MTKPQPTTTKNTAKAYAADWRQFQRWCRPKGIAPLPPSPETVALYLRDLASPRGKSPPLSVATIERRLSGLVWNYAKRGLALDRSDACIVSALADIRRNHSRLPQSKHAIDAQDICAMAATLPFDLRGLRDRAILLIGFAGRLRRSEIVGLDRSQGDTSDGTGWIDILPSGAVLNLTTKTGTRQMEIERGPSTQTCPVHALEHWLHFARIDFGPVFVRTSRDGTRALDQRLSDKHVARLVKSTALASGLRADLPQSERMALFSSQSLRA